MNFLYLACLPALLEVKCQTHEEMQMANASSPFAVAQGRPFERSTTLRRSQGELVCES
jgi:hypothetical protein